MTAPSLEDRAAIDDLYARYCWALDTGHSDDYVACFSEDAIVLEVQPDGSVLRAPVAPFARNYHAQERVRGHQHHQGTTLYEADPEGRPDHWRVRAYVLATHAELNDPATPHHPGARTAWAGYTDDIIGRVDGEWRIVERGIAPWTGALRDLRADAGRGTSG